jgi:hypothetical protein
MPYRTTPPVESEPERVYCINCKWRQKSEGSWVRCFAPSLSVHKSNWDDKWIEYKYCETLNEKNDCSCWEKKRPWYIRMFRR